MKANVDAAAELAPALGCVIMVAATGAEVAMHPRNRRYDRFAAKVSKDCPPEPIAA